MSSEQLVKHLIEQIHAYDSEIGTLLGNCSLEKLNEHPPGEAWSILEILDHILVADATYQLVIEQSVPRLGDGNQNPIKNSFMGKMLINMLNGKNRLPAPKHMHPMVRQLDISKITEFHKHQADLIDLLQSLQGKDLSSVKVKNPNFPISKLYVNELFEVIVAHLGYHVNQIKSRLG